MPEVVSLLLKVIGFFAVIGATTFGAVKYFGKKVIDDYFDRKKSLHDAALNKELEEFKDQLQKARLSYEIKFTRIYAEQVECIKNIYTQTVKVKRQFEKLYRQGISEKDFINELGKCYDEYEAFLNLYRPNEIILPEGICDQIEHLINALGTAFNDANIATQLSHLDIDTARGIAKRGKDTVDKEVPSILVQLKNAFRIMLGVEGE